MTLEDEEKDAMARRRPVLASVGACACFGLIIRSLIRCHTPAFHTAFCCLTRLTRDLGIELLFTIIHFVIDTIPTFLHVSWKYIRIRPTTLSAYRRVKIHKPWVRVNARNTCFGEHAPLGKMPKTLKRTFSSEVLTNNRSVVSYASLELVSTYCAWQVGRPLSPIA